MMSSISVLFLIISSNVYADTCSAKLTIYDAPQFFLLSDGVFSGTVQHIDNATDHQWKIYFTIDKLWRGSSSIEPLMVMTNTLQGCGYSIVQGEKYLVYTNGYPPFFNIVWSKPYADAQSDIAIIDDPKFQSDEKMQEELNEKLEVAKNKMSDMMMNDTLGIPLNLVGVDTINSTLNIGIDSTKATLSEEQYLEKIKAIVGDIPIKITFGVINPTANMTDSSAGNSFSKSIPSPLKQLEFGTQSENIQCNVNFVLIFKMENNSPACVTPQTGTKLIQIGWAMPTISLKPWMVTDTRGLKNDAGTITLENQTYYFDTPNYTEDAYSHSPQITFHGILFTLFPQPFSGGLPTGNCGPDGSDSYYWADAKFPDGTHEMLKILVDTEPCALNSIPANLSTHTNPQAGLMFYDGKMKLLVSTNVNNSTGTELPASFMPCDTTYLQSYAGVAVLYMPTNSTGKLCIQYSNPNQSFPSGFDIVEARNYNQNTDVMVSSSPESVSSGNSTIVDTIHSGNKAGFYRMLISCPGMQLAIGYDNSSNFVTGDFPWLAQTFYCPAQSGEFHIVGLSGIGVKYMPYP